MYSMVVSFMYAITKAFSTHQSDMLDSLFYFNAVAFLNIPIKLILLYLWLKYIGIVCDF